MNVKTMSIIAVATILFISTGYAADNSRVKAKKSVKTWFNANARLYEDPVIKCALYTEFPLNLTDASNIDHFTCIVYKKGNYGDIKALTLGDFEDSLFTGDATINNILYTTLLCTARGCSRYPEG